MYSPIPHNLTLYDDKFEFEKNGFCPYQWEISVPQKNCILWGVVLSYLRSADFTVPGKFEERLNRLTENSFDSERVKSAILDFNPFFNIHKCFFDETLQNLNQSFRKHLNETRPPTTPKTTSNDMQLISTLLKTNILIVDLSKRSLHLVSPSDGSTTDLAAITIICKEYWNKNGKNPMLMKRFTFSWDKDLCWELRIKAFHSIIESPEIRSIAEKEIQPLREKKEKKVNILITLLKKNLTHVISELYDSSYVVSKLSDAGFETDPRVVDEEGFSAFYYALQSSDSSLVYILYRYAANNCYESETTFRDPNPGIIANLSMLKEVLEDDCARSNNSEGFGDRAEQVSAAFQDLLRFNEFLSQVSQGFNEIRGMSEDTCVKKAGKQKEIILLILEKYDEFFSIGQLDSQHTSKEEFVENYSKHKTYYDNLDFTVALLFFDNIFLLKGCLVSPREGLYSELESSFLLSAITNKYLTGDSKMWVKIQDLGFESDSISLSIISLLERLNLREKVKTCCNVLREKQELVEEDTVKCIPQKEIDEMLSDFLALKDELLISRLDHYLETAVETTPEDLKQKFGIQRALLVIGESISMDEKDPSSIRHLLRKCLAGGTLDALKKTGNTLSHLKSFHFPLKFEVEKDDCLFASIQSEIRSIKEAFEDIFGIQTFRFIEFRINRGLQLAQKFQSTNIDTQAMENFAEKLRKSILELEQKEKDGKIAVTSIDEFCRILTRRASESVKNAVFDEIPLEVKTRIHDYQTILDDLDKGIALDSDRFDCLFVKRKDLESIKKEYLQHESKLDSSETSKISSLMQRIKKFPNPISTLDLIFEKKKVSDSQLKALFEAIPFSDKAKDTLESLIENTKSPRGDNLKNLLNRIEHLYEISINERSDIHFLWEKAKSSKARQYLVYKIVQRYFREPSFQGALEMLLFDCVGILKNNENFRQFWLKDSYLFNGIDLQNVLAHGNPLLGTIGGLLDPKDLPSELVKKMLQLFEDRECIESLCDVWQKQKHSDKIPDGSANWYKLKERIVCCQRWQEYSKLLAENPKDFETCESLISFLKNLTESNRKKKY